MTITMLARGQVEYIDSLLAIVGDKVITAHEIMGDALEKCSAAFHVGEEL